MTVTEGESSGATCSSDLFEGSNATTSQVLSVAVAGELVVVGADVVVLGGVVKGTVV